jgi:transcriptional regulator with XRE-family HTH domain
MSGIGQRLRQERTRLGLSQSALGTIGGVETNAQGNYESGFRSPKADYLSRIATAGVDVCYVVTGLGKPAENSSSFGLPPLNKARTEHLGKVTAQLHRNLHGIIDALYQMTTLVESHDSESSDAQIKNDLHAIKAEAESLAMATVRLIFVTSRLA